MVDWGSGSPIGALLLDVLVLFTEKRSQRLHSRTLVAGLNAWRDRPWAEMRNGKEITELWLARQFRPYGIRPKTLWMGEASAKGYEKEDFTEAFRRYIPKAELESLMEARQEGTAQEAAP
jgi:hypothetical protein